MWIKTERGTINFSLIKTIYIGYSYGVAQVYGLDINGKEISLSFRYTNEEKAWEYRKKIEKILDAKEIKKEEKI